MDSLIAKADALSPTSKSKKSKKSRTASQTSSTQTLQSISASTSIPKSLRNLPQPENVHKHTHIANKRLRTLLHRQSQQNARADALLKDAADMLLVDEPGMIEVEGELEKTWRVGQSEIVGGAGQEAARGRRELKLDGGPYRCRYARNGRHLAIVGRKGHVATFDWQTGTLHSELQLLETCRDITFLHNHAYYAVAQKSHVFIYDQNGVELHRLKSHVEPTRLEFLPYHFLLASTGMTGFLKYQDTSTGKIIAEHRTKFGACNTMTQNSHNAVIHLGHQNGRVTLWTPNLPQPAVQLLAHLGPVVSASVDSSQGGRYMATAGRDGMVKVWDCRNWKGTVREWLVRGAGDIELEWSARGHLAVANSGTVNVYAPPMIHTPFVTKSKAIPPPLYLTHAIPHRPLTGVRFAPFLDVLTIGHAEGLSSILVPGVGEPNFDSREADPFENKKAKREREVKGLLEKIQPDMITLDSELIGSLAPPSKRTTSSDPNAPATSGEPRIEIEYARLPRYERLRASGKVDATEEQDFSDTDGEDEDGEKTNEKEERKKLKEKKKMRGRNKSLNRYLRKQKKNIIDPKVLALRAKMDKQREERRRAQLNASGDTHEGERLPSALERFRRSTKV
ncbi:hypothetical protein AMATHDRAFT_74739 [Amanita thiersii Skay4041]|uniref:U three protein 7 n=1 Tax=Amanita thiersii Skay4041 TaxID=703135 RepID=A0A2A9NL10_9AGAR|nr:hypothetical protein AMATHDRAFT_74739 [Amanita thiersii Skay4041]